MEMVGDVVQWFLAVPLFRTRLSYPASPERFIQTGSSNRCNPYPPVSACRFLHELQNEQRRERPSEFQEVRDTHHHVGVVVLLPRSLAIPVIVLPMRLCCRIVHFPLRLLRCRRTFEGNFNCPEQLTRHGPLRHHSVAGSCPNMASAQFEVK